MIPLTISLLLLSNGWTHRSIDISLLDKVILFKILDALIDTIGLNHKTTNLPLPERILLLGCLVWLFGARESRLVPYHLHIYGLLLVHQVTGEIFLTWNGVDRCLIDCLDILIILLD